MSFLSTAIAAVKAKLGRLTTIEGWVVVLGLTCCVLGVIGLMRWSSNDAVEKIRVDASFVGLQASDLWTDLKPLFGQPLMKLDLPAIAEQVEQNPWVASVAVSRVWPDSLVLDITESDAFASWLGPNAERGFVSQAGQALEAEAETLPLRYEGSAAAAAEFVRLQADIAPLLDAFGWQLTALKHSDYGQWRAQVHTEQNQSIELRLGMNWNVARWTRLQQAWQAGLGAKQKTIAYIDLRYHGGLAVGWLGQQVSNLEKLFEITDDQDGLTGVL